MIFFEQFLDKISPLRTTKKLGAILFQLPPSFTVNDFKSIEQFLDKLPTTDGYDYAIEFRHPSWGTEGPWEMLRHYNIAAVMTDSPPSENLQFLSNKTITANQSFISFREACKSDKAWNLQPFLIVYAFCLQLFSFNISDDEAQIRLEW
jgi:uncharacterized protein YecE (DUF72 family)